MDDAAEALGCLKGVISNYNEDYEMSPPNPQMNISISPLDEKVTNKAFRPQFSCNIIDLDNGSLLTHLQLISSC